MSSIVTETATIGGTPASLRVCALTDTIREILGHLSGIELAKARINKQWEDLCLERVKRPGCGVSFIYPCNNTTFAEYISQVSSKTPTCKAGLIN